MTAELPCFATAPKGLEPLLADELRTLGAGSVRESRGGASFTGTLVTAYRACLWSRTANRVLLLLASVPAADADALHAGVYALPWEEHLDPAGTLAVDFGSSGSAITHTQYGAQRVKDGIVDRLRELTGVRPSVDRDMPDLRVNVYVLNDVARIALDLAGDSLHRRGYRVETVAAPLKENLAAALLIKAGWPALAAAGGGLVDPMCGSGTLAIEAALIAADRAPGLERTFWGFLGWRGHQPELWCELLLEARERHTAGMDRVPAIVACDQDPRALRATQANVQAAGFAGRIHVERRELARTEPPRGPAGLVIVNPPYGERLGELDELRGLYAAFGDMLKARFGGWQAALFTGNPELGKRMGLRAHKTNAFHNGALPCQLLQFRVETGAFVDREAADRRKAGQALERALAGGADAFVNRLKKNLRTLGRWAEREGISCYRLYDADIPEYAVAVDCYAGWVHIQEYAAPATIPEATASERLEQVLTVLPDALGVPAERIALKVRSRQRGSAQYERQAARGEFIEVREGPARLLVNLFDYLDTGLFLDHRITRALLGRFAQGRRFLNLFGYTGAATVHAALGGARATTTVDLSATYLDWAQRNMALNACNGPEHEYVRADCLRWLENARGHYGLIFLDPPTFSNSKRMEGVLDVQRDHVALIRLAVARLEAGGELIFSNNHRRFRLDAEALADLAIEDISASTIPRDFARNPRIHRCWRIRR